MLSASDNKNLANLQRKLTIKYTRMKDIPVVLQQLHQETLPSDLMVFLLLVRRKVAVFLVYLLLRSTLY